jgi:hypothetical protein
MHVGVRRRACARLGRRAEVCARKAASLGLLELSVTPSLDEKSARFRFLTESAYKGCTFSTQKKWSHFAHADGLAAVKIDGDLFRRRIGSAHAPDETLNSTRVRTRAPERTQHAFALTSRTRIERMSRIRNSAAGQERDALELRVAVLSGE